MESLFRLTVGKCYIKENLKKTRPVTRFNNNVFVVVDDDAYGQRLFYASGKPHYSNSYEFPIIAEWSEENLSAIIGEREREKLVVKKVISEEELDKLHRDWLERREFYREYGFAH
jgi:hypothetical protein